MHQDLNAAFSLAGRVAVGTSAAGIERETAHVLGGIRDAGLAETSGLVNQASGQAVVVAPMFHAARISTRLPPRRCKHSAASPFWLIIISL
jgi:hypothetical protein